MDEDRVKAYLRAAMHPEDCPPASSLEDFAADKSTPSPVAEHVANCPQCRAWLDDYEHFLHDSPDAPSHVDIDAEYRALRDRIEQSEPAPAPRLISMRRRWPVPALAVAASLLVATGASLWYAMDASNHLRRERAARDDREQTVVAENRQLREQLSRLSRPGLDTMLVDLFPAGAVDRSGTSPRIATVNAGQRTSLVLNGVAGTFGARVSISTAEGQELWAAQAQESGSNVVVTVPNGWLTPGVYVVAVRTDATRREFRFRVEAGSRPRSQSAK